MSPCGSTVFLLLCMLLASAQDGRTLSESEWPCEHVTPQRNISLDQMLGQWHLAEGYANNVQSLNTTECYTVQFTQVNESTISFIGPERQSVDYNIPHTNKPWYFKRAGITVLVIYLAGDNSKMVVVGCTSSSDAQGSYIGYTIVSRQLPLSEAETQELHQALGAAGVTRSEENSSFKSVATCCAA